MPRDVLKNPNKGYAKIPIIYLYINEWLECRGLKDQDVADAVGVRRESVWRWRMEQHRLTPEKQWILARILKIRPEDLWRAPDDVSIDALIADLPDETKLEVFEVVKGYIRSRAS